MRDMVLAIAALTIFSWCKVKLTSSWHWRWRFLGMLGEQQPFSLPVVFRYLSKDSGVESLFDYVPKAARDCHSTTTRLYKCNYGSFQGRCILFRKTKLPLAWNILRCLSTLRAISQKNPNCSFPHSPKQQIQNSAKNKR